MLRLRRADCSRPGVTRTRRGRGWAYYDPSGARVTDAETLERIAALVIPPAWVDVWISPAPGGHIQATGLDARGRRQYRYHDLWRTKQAHAKFDRVLEFAEALPRARVLIREDLDQPKLSRERVLACAARLLDLGFFRIGSEEYAETNQSYGLATMRREDVTVSRRGVITFDYIGKSGKRRVRSLADEAVLDVVKRLRRRRGGGPELLAHRTAGGGWQDIKSADINAYLHRVLGGVYSAKDFRTWHADVLAAKALAVSAYAAKSPTARRRAVARAVQEVAGYLGNTPAVCRSSYIDPRIIDLYLGDVTIDLGRLEAEADADPLAAQTATEAAVLELLRDPPAARRKAG